MPKKRAEPGAFVLRRRDGTGHLTREYSLDLRARSRANPEPNDGAFLYGTRGGDALAEHLGATVAIRVTSGEDAGEDSRDRVVAEQSGGPFVETTGNTEFAYGIDPAGPEGTWRKPFPWA
jgi:hypothetical protein